MVTQILSSNAVGSKVATCLQGLRALPVPPVGDTAGFVSPAEAVAWVRALEAACGPGCLRFFSRRLGTAGRAWSGTKPAVLHSPFPPAVAQLREGPEDGLEAIFLVGLRAECAGTREDALALLEDARRAGHAAWILAPYAVPGAAAPAFAPWRAGVAEAQVQLRVRTKLGLGAGLGTGLGTMLGSGGARPSAAPAAPASEECASGQNVDAHAQDRTRIATLVAHAHAGDCYLSNFARTEILCPALGPAPAVSDTFARALAHGVRFGGSLLGSDSHGVLLTSPERFVRTVAREDGRVLVFAEPIKGTAPCSEPPVAEDFSVLWDSRKETAEQILVTDLLRNDLNLVCEPGSVQVHAPFFQRVEGALLQMQTVVSGLLRPEYASPAALLAALLPAGSVSGTPKKRVCGILAELEANERGYYTGVAGLLEENGAFDSSVCIRSLFREGRGLVVGVGGGITSLSDPDAETRELALKRRAIARVWGSP